LLRTARDPAALSFLFYPTSILAGLPAIPISP